MYLGVGVAILTKDRYNQIFKVLKEKVNPIRWEKIIKQMEQYKLKEEEKKDEKSEWIVEKVGIMDVNNWQKNIGELLVGLDNQKYLKVLVDQLVRKARHIEQY